MAHQEQRSLDIKEVLATNSSSSDDNLDSPSTEQKRKSTESASSNSSDDSSTDDGISIHVYDEHGELDNELTKTGSRIQTQPLSRYATGVSTRTGMSVATNGTTDPGYEVDFEEDDPANPRNWPFWYRCCVIFFISYSTLTVVMYSTSYTSGIPGIAHDFHITSATVPVLGITTYMVGLALGSVILAPLSEMYGRRPIYIVSMAMFGLLTIPCALAPKLEAILITRFFGAIAGSAMISNAPGTVNDIVLEKHRALAFSIWSLGPMNGVSFCVKLILKSALTCLACRWAAHRWICLSVLRMEMDELGCTLFVWRFFRLHLFDQRDIRTRNPAQTGKAKEEGD
jgi:hypothetical protein